MNNNEWKYYNHALVPISPPDQIVNVEKLKDKTIWKGKGKDVPLFACWHENFDTDMETSYWYIIKDSPFDISKLKAKRRYEITKGNKNFVVKKIMPSEEMDDLLKVQKKAFLAYPLKYRPVLHEEKCIEEFKEWEEKKEYVVFGCYSRNENKLCGYACLEYVDKCIYFRVLKTDPSYEKQGINAAICYQILIENEKKLDKGYYICDGARPVRHETNFQDYLEKYFGYRKAYCTLKLQYIWYVSAIVKILYPIRNFICKFDRLYQVYGVLKLEEIRRGC